MAKQPSKVVIVPGFEVGRRSGSNLQTHASPEYPRKVCCFSNGRTACLDAGEGTKMLRVVHGDKEADHTLPLQPLAAIPSPSFLQQRDRAWNILRLIPLEASYSSTPYYSQLNACGAVLPRRDNIGTVLPKVLLPHSTYPLKYNHQLTASSNSFLVVESRR
jgi:hypothetical protein